VSSVPTFTATIYVGLKVRDVGFVYPVDEARRVCQKYCDEVGLCVTVASTEYIYTNGNEPGVVVGLINYPRFPAKAEDIRSRALVLAERLREALKQYRVSVVFPDETVTIRADK
jgi:hypothetical protein